VELDPWDVDVGTWDSSSGVWTSDPDGSFVLVEVTSPGQPLFFASLWGYQTFNPTATSIARKGAGGVPFPCMMFADTALQINGNATIDGWDSSRGSYYSTRASTASVCTNRTSQEIGGSADLRGDLHPGPEGTVTVKGSASLSGSTDPLAERIEPDTPQPPDFWDNQGIGDRINRPTTFPPGTYYFEDGLTVVGRGEIIISGPTSIYVGGDVQINANGFVNTTYDPMQLSVVGMGSHSLRINGSADFYGSIYMPDWDVQLNGNMDLYGSVVADAIKANGTGDIHLDAALIDQSAMAAGERPSGSALVF
jgi:hypothetical protein